MLAFRLWDLCLALAVLALLDSLSLQQLSHLKLRSDCDWILQPVRALPALQNHHLSRHEKPSADAIGLATLAILSLKAETCARDDFRYFSRATQRHCSSCCCLASQSSCIVFRSNVFLELARTLPDRCQYLAVCLAVQPHSLLFALLRHLCMRWCRQHGGHLCRRFPSDCCDMLLSMILVSFETSAMLTCLGFLIIQALLAVSSDVAPVLAVEALFVLIRILSVSSLLSSQPS